MRKLLSLAATLPAALLFMGSATAGTFPPSVTVDYTCVAVGNVDAPVPVKVRYQFQMNGDADIAVVTYQKKNYELKVDTNSPNRFVGGPSKQIVFITNEMATDHVTVDNIDKVEPSMLMWSNEIVAKYCEK